MSSAPGFLAERMQIVEGFPPVDQNTATNPGDWVSLKNYGQIHIVHVGAPGSATASMTIRVEQATDVAGAGVKALPFTTIHKKQAPTNLATIPLFTKIAQTATHTYVINTTTEGNLAVLTVITVAAEELDAEGGFDCIRAQVDKVTGTSAKLGTLLYFLESPRYAPPLTAIAD